MNESTHSLRTDLIGSNPIRLKLNGEPITSNAHTVAALLKEQGLDPTRPGIAVALNETLVLRSTWNDQAIGEGDRIEVITAMQGG